LLQYNPSTDKYEVIFTGSKEDALSLKDKMYFKLQEDRLAQDKKEFGESEERRKDAVKLAKMQKPVQIFNQDKIVIPAQTRLASAEAAQFVLKMGNPIGDEAVKTFLARASGEVGTLTDTDAARFGGSKSIVSRIGAITQQYIDGKLTDENRKYLMELTDAYKKSADDTINKRADFIARQQSQVVKIDKNVLKNAMLGYDVTSAEDQPNNETNAQSASPVSEGEVERMDPKTKKIAIFDAKTKQFLRYK